MGFDIWMNMNISIEYYIYMSFNEVSGTNASEWIDDILLWTKLSTFKLDKPKNAFFGMSVIKLWPINKSISFDWLWNTGSSPNDLIWL